MDFSATVIRPEDHLVLELEFRGVDFTPPSGATTGEVRGAAGALPDRSLPAAAHPEQAFYQSSEDLADRRARESRPRSRRARSSRGSAGTSRLAFDVPKGEKFPYTLDGVLEAIKRLPLSVTPVSAYNPD